MMKSPLIVCALLISCCFALSSAGGGDGPDPTISIPGVIDLTPENFDSVVNGGKAVLVEFYAPWCGHCKHLVPELIKLAELIAADPLMNGRVVIAKVNADTHRELGTRFDVKGFPTLKFFGRGKAATMEGAADYNSARTSDAFYTFLKEQLEADSGFARVESLDTFAKGFSDSKDQAAALKGMTKAAATLDTAADKSNAELYIKYATKAVEKGSSYLTTEKARLDKILASGSVAASKVEDFSKKSSILGYLTE